MTRTRPIAALTLALGLLAPAAQAQTPLKDVAYVREGIIAVGIAYEISEKCSSIGARTVRGLLYLRDLQSHARGLGYSQAEIDAYTKDKAEKARLEGIARARLADLGASDANPESYCVVGRDQIAKGTAVGRLLR